MSGTVIFSSCGPLYLDRVTRDKNGRVRSGFVVNGGWNFEIKEDEQFAKAGGKIVNRWPDEPFDEVVVPDSVGGDYNEVINWAQKRRTK